MGAYPGMTVSTQGIGRWTIYPATIGHI